MMVGSRRAAVAVTLAAVTLSMSACAPAMDHGTVIDKRYEPERRYTTFIYCGKGCMVPTVRTDDEDWYLGIQDGERTGWVEVTQDYYDAAQIGDYYDRRDR